MPDANAGGIRLSTQELRRFEFAFFPHFIHEKIDALFRDLELGGNPRGLERLFFAQYLKDLFLNGRYPFFKEAVDLSRSIRRSRRRLDLTFIDGARHLLGHLHSPFHHSGHESCLSFHIILRFS